MNTVKLYRPVGLKELELIMDSGWKKFPPRLAWQPIFYPVLNQAYAAQIASEWNTRDEFSGNCGVVTAFDLEESHFLKYAIQNVGGEIHNEKIRANQGHSVEVELQLEEEIPPITLYHGV